MGEPLMRIDCTCCYCHRAIYMVVSGDWYHDHNASVSCYPGAGSDRRATPAGVRA
jgi:hypothetical protein